jgi:WD40 repeat protein
MKLVAEVDQKSPVAKLRFDPKNNALISVSATHDRFEYFSFDRSNSLWSTAVLGSGQEAHTLHKDVGFERGGRYLAFSGRHRPTELMGLTRGMIDNSDTSVIGKNVPGNHSIQWRCLPGPWSETDHHCAQFSWDGKYLVLGSAVDNKSEVFDVQRSTNFGSFWLAHSLSPHPEGEIMACVINQQAEGGIHFIRMTDRLQCFGLYLMAFPNISSVRFSPLGNRLAVIVCCIDMKGDWFVAFQVHDFPGCSLVWERKVNWPTDCQPLWLLSYRPSTFPIDGAVFDAAGNRILCPFPNGDLVEFDICKDAELGRWPAHRETVMTLDIRYQDARLVSGGSDGMVKLWQLDDAYRQILPSTKTITEAFLKSNHEVDPFAPYWELQETQG